jgi:triosephosphate isomerase
MRQRIVAGNWKMNKLLADGLQLAADILVNLEKNPPNLTVILCPPYVHLADLAKMLKGCSYIKLGAQNCHIKDEGAYTGEVSVPMIASVGIDYVIAGHSERRQFFGETDQVVSQKVKAILTHGLHPIFCCGEPLDIRQQNKHFDFVQKQLNESILNLPPDELKSIVIAYEPIWAIGTGVNASPQQAQEMHGFIRGILKQKFGNDIADTMPILYGGSVKPDNAGGLFSQPDVDGGLVGGASLVAGDFVKIIASRPD